MATVLSKEGLTETKPKGESEEPEEKASHVSEPVVMGPVYLRLNLAVSCCCAGGCDSQEKENDEGMRRHELKRLGMFVRPHSKVER